MKKFYLIAIILLSVNFSFAAPVINAIANGNWSTPGTWDLNRVPQVNDTIVIPFGKKVTVNTDNNLNGFVYIKISGELAFQNNGSTLNLGNAAIVMVYKNAVIEGGGSASQKIRIGNDQVFKGNDEPVVGPQTASALTNGFISFAQTTLPVKFVGFTAVKRNNDVLVQWSTSEEINANMYELERSFDGNTWNTIAYISPIGTAQNLNNYSYSDKNITAKVVYYRIKQVDVDGRFSYTAIRSIKNEIVAASDIRIASVENRVVLQFAKEIKGNVVVRFVTVGGQIIEEKTINQAFGQVVLTAKTKGNQIVSVTNGQDVNVAKQVML